MEADITFTSNQATVDQINTHLLSCNQAFFKELSKKTNIADYSKKIVDHSVRFEAWDKGKLIGLIAAYFNDHQLKFGFITNVSVSSGYIGKGIASKLLETCIGYGKQNNFKQIGLEVLKTNSAALKLYEKHFFSQAGETGENINMKLDLC